MGKNEKYKLTGRELEVMQVLWTQETAMSATNIGDAASLSIHTVQTVAKSLLAKGYLKISDVGYSGTVLTRLYKPTFSAIDYIKTNFSSFSKHRTTIDLLSAFIDETENLDFIDELDILLEKRKKELEEKDK